MLKATAREKERRRWVITRLFAVLFTLGAGSEDQNLRNLLPQASMCLPYHHFVVLPEALKLDLHCVLVCKCDANENDSKLANAMTTELGQIQLGHHI